MLKWSISNFHFSVSVTLVGSRSFKGFLILALPFDDDTGEPIGSFEVANPANSNLGQVQCGKVCIIMFISLFMVIYKHIFS